MEGGSEAQPRPSLHGRSVIGIKFWLKFWLSLCLCELSANLQSMCACFFVLSPRVIFLHPVISDVCLTTPAFLFCQLFRRVAAALPGMDTTQDKSREDSILVFVRSPVPLLP